MKSRLIFVFFSTLFAWGIMTLAYFYFLFRLEIKLGRTDRFFEISSLISPLFIEVIVFVPLVVGFFYWVISGRLMNETNRVSRCIKQMTRGNLDMEIPQVSYVAGLDRVVDSLEDLRLIIRKDRKNLENQVADRTKELSQKIQDLEKMREVMTDSILLAKKSNENITKSRFMNKKKHLNDH